MFSSYGKLYGTVYHLIRHFKTNKYEYIKYFEESKKLCDLQKVILKLTNAFTSVICAYNGAL